MPFVLFRWGRTSIMNAFFNYMQEPIMKLRIYNVDTTPLAADTAAQVEIDLNKVNGRAKAFAVQTFSEIKDIATRAEEMLEERLVPASYRPGSILTYRPAGPFASSYGDPVRSTEITLTRGRDAWFLIGIERIRLRPGDLERKRLAITSEAQDATMRRLLGRSTTILEKAA